MSAKILWGVWLFNLGKKGDWARADEPGSPIMLFESKRKACSWAQEQYGFNTYTETKDAGWAEVRPLAVQEKTP